MLELWLDEPFDDDPDVTQAYPAGLVERLLLEACPHRHETLKQLPVTDD